MAARGLAVAAPVAARAPALVGPGKADQYCDKSSDKYDPLGRDVTEFARSKKYSCHGVGCGKQFKTKKYRNEHHRQAHMGVKVKCPFGCGKKYQRFNRPSNLAKHFSGRVGSKRHHRDQMVLRLSGKRQPRGDGGDGDGAPMAVEDEALGFAQQLFRDAREVTAPIQMVEVTELPFLLGYL